ncbi:MAG: HAD hydrolase-like protein [Herpetosiphon sp.]
MAPLVLWDIDGTLVRGTRSLTASFNRALRTVYRLQEPLQSIQYGGKTDGQIVLELLGLHGVAESDALALLPEWEQHYCALARAGLDLVKHEIEILPGVPEALSAMKDDGVLQSLLTGNLRPTAEIKLAAAGIRHSFDWEIGAFGSDNRDRDFLVSIAEHKARTAGHHLDRTIVIGDTPRDIQCARAGNAMVIAVATGHFSVAELEEHRPDLLLPDLRDTGALIAAVREGNHARVARPSTPR